MQIRQATVVLLVFTVLAGALAGCGPGRFEFYQRLPEQDKEIYDRTHQFMTERQQERFLEAPTSAERVRLVESLQIHARLSKFAPHEREAILAQRIVPGMSAEAVLLSWGRPLEIDRRTDNGVPLQCWRYSRGTTDGTVKEHRVYFVNGLVSETEP